MTHLPVIFMVTWAAGSKRGQHWQQGLENGMMTTAIDKEVATMTIIVAAQWWV